MPVLVQGQEQRVDAPIRIGADDVGGTARIGGPEPGLTPRRKFSLLQRLDDLLGDLIPNLFLGCHRNYSGSCGWLCRVTVRQAVQALQVL